MVDPSFNKGVKGSFQGWGVVRMVVNFAKDKESWGKQSLREILTGVSGWCFTHVHHTDPEYFIYSVVLTCLQK